MDVILFLIFFLIAFGSIITTFVAIFQILSNDFNGSKGLWILISMIGIIGPILYLIKGRKLLIKKEHREIENSDGSNSQNQYYSELLSGLDLKIKIVAIVSIGLIITGYLFRIFDLYYFWESKPVGFMLFFVSLAVILRKDINTRKTRNIKNVWSHIGFWLISFVLFIKILMTVILPNSDAYIAAKDYLENDDELLDEIGEIRGFTVLPSGSLESSTNSNGTYGSASINLIIKGTEKFKEANIYLVKTPDEDWIVKAVR